MANQRRNKTPARRMSVQFPTHKRLATTMGHVLWFEPGVPQTVSERVYREAMKQGGIDGKQKITIESSDEDGTEGAGSDSGVLKVAQACREIIDSEETESMTSDGTPKVDALTDKVGFPVSAELRNEAMKMVEEGIV